MLGLAPVVPVPPDVISGVHIGVRGAAPGLDAVDVVEPVDRPSAFLPAGETVDALHEAAPEARGDPRVAHQQAHDSLLASDLRSVRCTQQPRAEVARHAELDRARGRSGAQAAAGERQRARGGE